MSFIVVANWKVNLSEVFNPEGFKCRVIIAAPFTHIALVNDEFRAAQNVSLINATGEISAKLLKSLNVKYCLVGHLERRKFFQEAMDGILLKVEMLLSEGIIPIVCLNRDDEINQLIKFKDEILLAYEPAHTVGKDVSVSDSDLEEVKKLREIFPTVLYGGNVNVNNFRELKDSVDGFLIGRASLKREEFLNILRGV